FTLALLDDGRLYSWGMNESGELGLGHEELPERALPILVTAASGVTAVAAGERHALAVDDDGTVWSWGNDDDVILGRPVLDDASTPVQIPGLADVVTVAAGYEHSLALTAD